MITVCIAFTTLWIIRTLIIKLIWKITDDIKKQYRWRKTTTYVIVFIGIIIFGIIWFENTSSIATFLGLVSAGLAIALKDLVANLAAWMFIVIRRPFEVGDRIQMGEYAGDVIDIRVFQFTLMEIGNWVDADQSTGRIIQVPNGKVFHEALANYSKGFQYIWNEIPVLVTFESDWRKAKTILEEIINQNSEHISTQAEKSVKQANRKYMIFYSNLTPIVYTKVQDSGVLLSIRYLCKPRNRRSSEQVIWEEILSAFEKYMDIDFAYPTYRYYDQRLEGKTGK
jgi:small-conductance mechanosensitive channel